MLKSRQWILAALALLVGIGAALGFRLVAEAQAGYIGAFMIMAHSGIMWGMTKDQGVRTVFVLLFLVGALLGLYTLLG